MSTDLSFYIAPDRHGWVVYQAYVRNGIDGYPDWPSRVYVDDATYHEVYKEYMRANGRTHVFSSEQEAKSWIVDKLAFEEEMKRHMAIPHYKWPK